MLVSLLVTVVDLLDSVHSSGFSIVSVGVRVLFLVAPVGFLDLVQIRSKV